MAQYFSVIRINRYSRSRAAFAAGLPYIPLKRAFHCLLKFQIYSQLGVIAGNRLLLFNYVAYVAVPCYLNAL